MINIGDLKKEYALSCIENYLLYLFSQKNYSWEYIYYKSFKPLKNIIYELGLVQGFSYYTGLDRLQKVAEELGLGSIEKCSSEKICDLDEHWFAIQVPTEYMIKKYNYKPWRDDHYIMLHKVEDKFEYINDFPPDSGVIEITEAKKLSADDIIIFNIVDNPGNINVNLLLEKSRKILSSFPDTSNLSYGVVDDFKVDRLRDAVCVEKILVKRQSKFLKIYGLPFDENEKEYYEFLSYVQSKLEYYRLKKCPNEKWMDLLSMVLDKDIEYYGNLKQKFSV